MIRKNVRQNVYIAQQLFYIAHVYMTYKTLTTLFTLIHGCNNDVSGQSWGSAWKEMEFGRLSFTTETASACIIDGIAWGGTPPEVMQAVAVPKPHITPILRLEWAGRWRGIGSRGSSIHLGSAEVERWNSDALHHPIAALSEEVEQYLETPNQALIRRPWTSSKKSNVSFVCIFLSPYVAEGRTTARNKRASIALLLLWSLCYGLSMYYVESEWCGVAGYMRV